MKDGIPEQRRPEQNQNPSKSERPSDFATVAVVAIVCATILGVVWVIWG